MNKIGQEDRYKIKALMERVNKGSFGNANEIVNIYNKVFDGVKRKQQYTRCSSCLIRYIRVMHDEVIKQENEEKLEALKAIDEFMIDDDEQIDDDNPIEDKPTKKKGGRPKKNG